MASLIQNPQPPDDGNAGRWSLTSDQGDTLVADTVIICAGHHSPRLIPIGRSYRIKAIRGQITEVPEDRLRPPSVVICGPGYVNPAFEGSSLVGATFDLHNDSPVVAAESDRENLEMISKLLPAMLAPSDVEDASRLVRGRVAFRCTTHDYQPIAGPMKTREGEILRGMYLFTGLGSKGLTYSPLLAEYLADQISGQPPCLPGNLITRVETQRCHRPETASEL